MKDTRASWHPTLIGMIFCLLALFGCGGTKGPANTAQYYGSYHPSGWMTVHGGQAVAGVDACKNCHEISIIKTGSGIPTCMTTGCHHQSTPGFADPSAHGLRGKSAITAANGAGLVSCQICHAKDFTGGPSANACSTCHIVKAPHPPKPWRIASGSTFTHVTTDPSNAPVCAQCHFPGSVNNPAGHPAIPAPSGTQPGCFNATLCHDDRVAPHPIPFLAGMTDSKLNGHMTVTAAAFAADCASCHAYTGTSPTTTAPLCGECHQLADPTLPGTNAGTCLSCHSGTSGLPKGPGGTGYPSIAGAHLKHLSLATTLTCNTCHAGSGSGTFQHYDNANARLWTLAGPGSVAVDVLYKAKTGGNPTFIDASLTCSNVSCHGGQATPGWEFGTISTSTQCTACHGVAASAATTVQFNDAFGRHSLGTHNATNAANAIACTTCHNMSNGSAGALAHFKYLNTPAVDGVSSGTPVDQLPSGTIAFDPLIVTAGTYAVTSTTQGSGTCALTCHTHIHTAAVNDWTFAGVPHPIPFLTGQKDAQGNGHLNATATTFAADCANCHAYSGTSPNASSPLCVTCHALANPTVLAAGTGTCLSCHVGPSGLPKGPAGTGFPSLPGAHAKHFALPTTLTCDTCHTGSGAGTATHYANANARTSIPTGPATVSIDLLFKGKTGGNPAFTPAALTCSNVSCHGSQATPAWQGGTLNSLVQCTACHGVASSAGTAAQYNDAFGRHSLGTHNATNATNAIACTTCHNMGNASAGALAHFKYLNTPAVDGVATGLPVDQMPSGTIAFDAAIVTAGTYTVTSATQGNGGCALTCHTHIHVATVDTWTASGSPHPVPFLTGQTDTQGNGHLSATATTFSADCSTCHAYSGTSPMATAPLCNVCHKLANPTLAGSNGGTCLSCHAGTSGLPKGPGGTSFPSIAGAHTKHLSLGTATSCDTCHAGSGTGTTAHYTNADARHGTPAGPAPVLINATFNAKTGTSAFTPASLTCSNVSCHGGQATPSWNLGTINSSTQCTACHSVASSAATATQYNDAFGRHSLGTHNATNAANAIACTTCHSMGNGSPGALAHFKYLNTTAVDGVATGLPADQLPSGTIVFNPAIVTGPGTYTVTTATQGNGGCALTCHTHIHTAAVNDWTSIGVPHPIPFLTGQTDTQGNGHLSITAAKFTADCASCHAYTGTSPVAAAPLCSTCHTLANPTVLTTGTGTCLSCHAGPSGLPKGPTGAAFPSIAGAHAKHMSMATTLTCDTCHAGSGAGTGTHYANANARTGVPTGPATVAIDLLFSAKTGGTPAFTPASLTCSNVSCHGAQTTPGWQVGTLNSSTQCTACHGVATSAGTITQYNDAFGRHSLGTHNATNAANAIACTTCHNMGNGSAGALAHFKYLNTGAVDGVATGVPADQLPSGTIAFNPAIVTGAGTYTVTSATQGNGGCALTCHTHIHAAAIDTWTASGAPHAVPFYSGQTDTQGNGHLTATAATFAADCATCHVYSGTSPLATAPACVVCHAQANPTQVATGVGTCLSCHVGSSGLPTGPTGVSFPSITGAHVKHMGLLTPLTCNTCHANASTGTTTHYNNANARIATPTGPGTVSIDALYHAQSGNTAGFNVSALTCSSTSCHGGLDTPNWRTGTITSTSQCTLCHAINYGTTPSQYNDAIGRHAWGTHSTAGTLDCTICHDMTLATPGAQNHFAELNTTPVSSTNKLPSTTIKFNLGNTTYPITGAATYTINATYPEGDGGCALTCHSQIHTPTTNHWAMPKGSGVAHPVPFLSTDVSTGGNHHQTLTLAQFNGECLTCHDQGGVSAKTGPTCNVCHTLADPTAVATGAGTCLSCHVGTNFKTQGPTGNAWPNLQGAHPTHLSLLTFTRTTPALPAALSASVCEACHVGSVPGDSANTHYSNANKRLTPHPVAGPASVSIIPSFNAQSGAAGFTASATAFTCSNVSCHGGQTTPGWQAGTNPVNATTYCIACHKITSTATQYNDATGRHNNPGAHNTTCDYCHDMTQNKQGAIDHWKYLDTSAVRITPDQLSSDTIKFGGGAQPATGALTYTVNATIGRGGCALTCHGQDHTASGNVWN